MLVGLWIDSPSDAVGASIVTSEEASEDVATIDDDAALSTTSSQVPPVSATVDQDASIVSQIGNGAIVPGEPDITERPVPSEPSPWVTSTLESLTVPELVSQLFVVELTPDNAAESLAINDWGGVFLKLEEEEPAFATEFITGLQTTALDEGIGLIVSSDVEGGRIIKMPVDFHELPGLLGETDREISSVNRRVAGELCGFGLNLNLAPVADVDLLNNPVLRDGRSFSDDASEVARYVDLFIDAYSETGGPIATTTKHFPGHGATNVDSHLGIANVGSRESLESLHLAPFETAIAQYQTQPGAIMIGHLVVDGQTEPATFSNEIVSDWLRGDLGYDGVIISDDLAAMEAITDRPPSQRAIDALVAGIDLLLWVSPDDAATAREALIQEVFANPNGEIAQRVDESVTTILTFKEQLGLHDSNANRCGQ